MENERSQIYSKYNPRIPVFYWAFSLAYLVLIAALGYRQIYLFDYYQARGERQSMRRVIEPGTRGDIFDRNGKLLVANQPQFSAVVYFNDVRKEFREEYTRLKKETIAKNPSGEFNYETMRDISYRARLNVLNGYIDQINSLLGTDYKLAQKDFNRHFNERGLLPFPLVKNLTAREHAILAEKIPVNSPIQIYTDTGRYYPYGELAAHALGYVGNNFDDIDTSGIPGEELMTYMQVGKIGRSGIERAFNEQLTGKSGVKIWIVDLDGYQYESVVDVKPTKGENIVTSLDIDLQGAVEDAFADRKGGAVMLDVNSGEVLSLVSRPSYDPNTLSPFITNKVYKEISDRGAWLNRATQGLYPPGSTFKIVTACAALMTGVIEPDSIKTCTGRYKVGNRMFPCNNHYGHGNLDLKGAIKNSCNVYFYEAALDSGSAAITETAKDFGLDSSTGIEIGDSTHTIVSSPDFKKRRRPLEGPWNAGDTANMSIGQGYLLQTPIQMACMAASFARGQTRTKASIIHDPNRKADMEYHGAEKLDLSAEQYRAIWQGMVDAVESGTARRAKVEGVSIAAKSGTAQVSVQGKKLTLAWMIAFAPAEKPEVAMSVVIEGEEVGDVAGGRTAGPIIHAAMRKYFEKNLKVINPQ